MRDYYAEQHPRTPPLSQSATFVVVTVLLAAVFVYWLVWTRAYHYSDLQTAEFLVYAFLAVAVPGLTIFVLAKRKEWRENQLRYPPLVMDPAAVSAWMWPSCSPSTYNRTLLPSAPTPTRRIDGSV